MVGRLIIILITSTLKAAAGNFPQRRLRMAAGLDAPPIARLKSENNTGAHPAANDATQFGFTRFNGAFLFVEW